MIRFAWLRFRTQALVALGVLAVLAVVLVVTGIRPRHFAGLNIRHRTSQPTPALQSSP
jgi:hypothetical protein